MDEKQLADYIMGELQQFKKVRLIEDKLSYEDLALEDNFSDEEITMTLNRTLLRERKDR